MSEKKEKFTYWLDPSLVDEMSNMLSEANATSKGEFVRQSIKFYIAYIRQNKSIDFLSPLLASTIKTQVESVEQNISEMLFKFAVEQGMTNHITAATNEISDKEMDDLRRMCATTIASTNGVIEFEDAYKFQKGDY